MNIRIFFSLIFSVITIFSFGQAEFKKNIISDGIGGPSNFINFIKTADGCYLLYSTTFDSATINLLKHEINRDAVDLFVVKINQNGEIINKIRFYKKDYEYPEAICRTRDGIYLVSRIEINDNLTYNYFISLKKLDTTGNVLLMDTVFYITNPYNINVCNINKKGIGLLYTIPDLINGKAQKTSNFCFKLFDDNARQLISKVLENEYFAEIKVISTLNNNTFKMIIGKHEPDTNKNNLKRYTVFDKIYYEEILIDSIGNIIEKMNVKSLADFELCDNRYAYLAPQSVQIDKIAYYNPRIEGRFDYIYSIKFFILDSSMCPIIERVLVKDTNVKVFETVKAFHTKNDEFLICATFPKKDKDLICIWKLDKEANIIWQKCYNYEDFIFQNYFLFEEDYGYTIFCPSFRKSKNKEIYGHGIFMMKIDKDGNTIKEN